MPSLGSLEETGRQRHANPKSGWSRVVVLPTLVYAVSQQNRGLAISAVVCAIVNPLLFSSPDDDSAWMSRVVRAERWWTQDHRLVGLSAPNDLNAGSILITSYAFLAAVRKQPWRTAVAGALSMGRKFWCVAALVRRYDTAQEHSS